MRVLLLGPLEVREGDELVEIRGARLRALLVRLAVDAGRVVSVESLAETLWGGQVPEDTLNALQSLVSRLRRSLPQGSMIESHPNGYLLTVDPGDVDALRFEGLARRGRQSLRDGDPAAASEQLAEALGLWRGEALVELRETAFGDAAVADLERAHRGALEDRLEADVRLGHGPDVLAELQNLAQADPFGERVAGLLMQALVDAGRQSDALDAYEHLRSELAERLGVDPSPALQDIYLRILRGDVGHATRVANHRSNLPSPVSSFLGRGEDLERLATLLANHRLVTVVGPGGCGKTRLAVEAAAHERGSGPVWLVELAPVTDPDDIAQAALDALDLRNLPALETRRRRPARDALMYVEEALGDGNALIVLDNCEHLVNGAARVAEHLLSRCPQLRILATSREPLVIAGEVLHPIRTLTVPADGATTALALESDAVRLFLDRTLAVDPGFVLDEDTTPAVIEVCRRLDGLPLAIELAAARMRTLTAQQLEGRLDDRFRLLTGGSRTAVARHRTLRAVVEWSWGLLSEDERNLADRFSVFPGGADSAAAQAVCLPGMGADDVDDALAALAEKSLLQVVASRGARTPRYRMLETLREYGSERMAARGELLSIRSAHTSYYRDLAERNEPLLRTEVQRDALALIDAERDNILAALRFAIDEGDADSAVRLAAAMGWFWLMRDSHAEAEAWMRMALAVPGDSDLNARALVSGLHLVNAAASGQIELSDDDSILHLLEAMPDIDPASGHPLLALVRPAKSLLKEDPALWEEAFQRGLTHPDPWAKGALYLLRFQFHENLGQPDSMLDSATRALGFFRPTGDRWGVAISLTSLGGLLTMNKDYEGALAAYAEGARLTTELLPDSRDNAEVLLRQATVHGRMGNLHLARDLIDRARISADESGSRHHRVFVDMGLAQLEWLSGDLVACQGALDAAEQRLAESPVVVPQMHAVVHAAHAQLAVATGDLDNVQGRLARAYTLARATRDNPIAATVAVAASAWLGATGAADQGAKLLGAGAALRGADDDGNPEVAWVTTSLRSQLGDGPFRVAYAEGRALSGAQALDLLGAAVGVDRDAKQVV